MAHSQDGRYFLSKKKSNYVHKINSFGDIIIIYLYVCNWFHFFRWGCWSHANPQPGGLGHCFGSFHLCGFGWILCSPLYPQVVGYILSLGSSSLFQGNKESAALLTLLQATEYPQVAPGAISLVHVLAITRHLLSHG